MIVWLLVSLAIWIALAGGVWALLFARGEREERSLDAVAREKS